MRGRLGLGRPTALPQFPTKGAFSVVEKLSLHSTKADPSFHHVQNHAGP